MVYKLDKLIPKFNGKVGFGVLLVLAVVGAFSIVLVFGLTQLSPYHGTFASAYQCCDSGDGSLCTPNADIGLRVRINGQEVDYQLLKSEFKLFEGVNHLAEVPQGDVIFGAAQGQRVYLNTVSENGYLQGLYVTSNRCSIHGVKLPPMDTIFARNLTEGCEAIPNDEIIYLCTDGCENGAPEQETGVFSAYFRASDVENPGIPESIKNCIKPSGTQLTTGAQRFINLPSPSIRPDLQLETFYVEQGIFTASWVSPYCKPAVYLYPEKESDIHVRIAPQGKILLTIPEYPQEGWKVKAYPNGDIYQNGTRFDYLFYEASIPDEKVQLPKDGFIVKYDQLSGFLPTLVSKLGLNRKEEKQFSEYWLNVLPKAAYYQIKIVKQSTLGAISPLYIIPFPDTSIRVTLHFTPLDKNAAQMQMNLLKEPEISTPERKGFTVVEWGGIFKRDKNHDFSCFM